MLARAFDNEHDHSIGIALQAAVRYGKGINVYVQILVL